MFYFGCWTDRTGRSEIGHYLRDRWGHRPRDLDSLDWPDAFGDDGWFLDLRFCPNVGPSLPRPASPWVSKGPQVEGEAALHHVEGWTVISFWDRSVDTRGGCNSAFLQRGTWTFEEMVAQARILYPQIWARFKFEVRCVGGVIAQSEEP